MTRTRKGAVDVAEMKAVLEMAHTEWGHNGLIANENSGIDVGDFTLFRNLDAYRGEFPDALGSSVDGVDQFVGNMIFSIANTLVSQLSASDPKPVLKPSGDTAAAPDAWRRAWLNERLLQTMARERKFKREVDRALLSAILCDFGFVRHGFTPEIEEFEDEKGVIHARFKNHTPDLPWIQARMPWQVRIDPLVNNFDMDGEPQWIAFHNIYTAQQIRNDPNLIFRDDWKPTFHVDLRPLHERRKPRISHDSNLLGQKDDKRNRGMSMYEEWVVYDAARRTFYGISPGSDMLVREEREWPIEWGQLPGSLLQFNEQMDSPFGIPFPNMIWREQMLYNKIWTVINAFVNRTRRVIAVNGSAFQQNADQLDNLVSADSLAEFIIADGPVQDIVKETSIGTIDGQLVGLLFQLKEQMREVLGVSSFDRGQRANVQTAAEANQIGQGAAIGRSRTQSAFEAFWVDIYRTSHRAMLQVADARKLFIPIVGEENMLFLTQGEAAQGFVEVAISDLAGEFDYGVRLNSTLPNDPAAEFAVLAKFYEIIGGPQAPLANHVLIQRQLATLAGQDAQRMIVDQQVAEQIGQDPEAQGAPGANAGAAPQVGVEDLEGLTGGGT